MNPQAFVYITTSFDLVSLFFNVPGVFLYGCEKSGIFLSDESRLKEKEINSGENLLKITGRFSTDTDFIREAQDLKNLYLVDANNLTETQISDLKKLVESKKCNVYIFSHKYQHKSKVYTKTYKQLSELKDQIMLQKIAFACPCGTYDVEISKNKIKGNKCKKISIHGRKYYTKCNLRCQEVDKKEAKVDFLNKIRENGRLKKFGEFLNLSK